MELLFLISKRNNMLVFKGKKNEILIKGNKSPDMKPLNLVPNKLQIPIP